MLVFCVATFFLYELLKSMMLVFSLSVVIVVLYTNVNNSGG